MALQIRRGTDAQRQNIILEAGEPFYVTNHAAIGGSPLWIGDGTTLGGVVAEGAINIDELLDVTITNPLNNQLLQWSTADGTWKNQSSVTIPGSSTISGNATVGGNLSVTGTTSFTGNITSGGIFTGALQSRFSTTIGDDAADPLTINSNTASVPNGLDFKKLSVTSNDLSSSKKVISLTEYSTTTDTVTLTGSVFTDLNSTISDGQPFTGSALLSNPNLTGFNTTTTETTSIDLTDNKITFKGTGLKQYANGAPITSVEDIRSNESEAFSWFDGFNYLINYIPTYGLNHPDSTHNFPRTKVNILAVYYPDNFSQSSTDALFSFGSSRANIFTNTLYEPNYPVGTKITWPSTATYQIPGLTKYNPTFTISGGDLFFTTSYQHISVPPGTPCKISSYQPTTVFYLRTVDSITNPTTNWFKGQLYVGNGTRLYVYPTKADALANTNRITNVTTGGTMTLYPDRPDTVANLSLYYAGNKKWAFTYADAIANNPITRNDLASTIVTPAGSAFPGQIFDSTNTNAVYQIEDTNVPTVLTSDIKLYFVNSTTSSFNIHYDRTLAEAGTSLGTTDGFIGFVGWGRETITSTPDTINPIDPSNTYYLYNNGGSVKMALTYADAINHVSVPYTAGVATGTITIGAGPGYGPVVEFNGIRGISPTIYSNAAIGTELVNSLTGQTDLVVKVDNAGTLTTVGRFTSTSFVADSINADSINVTDITIENDTTIQGDLTLVGNTIKNSSGSASIYLDTSGNVAVAGNISIFGNNIRSWNGTTGATAITLSNTNNGDVTIAGDLRINGNDIKSSDGSTAITLLGNTVTIPGNLTVSGTTTTVNSTTLDVADNMITLNKNETGAGVTLGVAGIEIERGTLTNAYLQFNEGSDRWEISNGSTFNTLSNQNLDATSSPTFVDLTLTGDLALNGGDVTTTAPIGNLYNTGPATVNIGNAATTEVNLGNTGSGARVQVKSPTIVGANTTQAVFNTVATTVNAFGAATAVNIGANSGTTTINNALKIVGDVIKSSTGVTAISLVGSNIALNGDLALGSTVTLNQTTKFDGSTFVINPTTNRVGINTDTPAADLHVNGTIFGNDIVGLNNLGSNTKTLTMNYDNDSNADDAFFKINRGIIGNTVAIRWNETTDRWQFSNNGSDPVTSTWNDMLIASDLSYDLNSLTDVVINTPATNQLLKYNGTNWVNSTVSYALDDLSDVVITSSTTGQLMTYNGTNWVNNNTITATSAAQTVNLTRSGAFTADTAGITRNALRLTKKFTDVSGTVNDKGGPTLTFNVEGSDNTVSTYAAITSNRSATGAHSVSVLTSSDNFTTNTEVASFTPTDASFPGTVSTSGVIIDSRVIKNTATQTYTSTSQQVFGNVPIATFRSVKYTWQISRGTEFQMLETLVIHDGTNAYITTFGDTRTGANLANFDVDISGSNMRILVTPTSTASTVLIADYTLFYI